MSRKRARTSVPPMTPEQAILLLDVLDRITDAVWRAYGPEMVEHPLLQGCLQHSDDLVTDGNPDAPDDTEF